MNLIKKTGIVICQRTYRESDKMLTLFLKDLGKINSYVHGAKKLNNKLFCASQTFLYAQFLLRENKNFYSIDQIDIIENLSPKNYINFCYATYFCELVDKYLMQNEPANNILILLVKTLKILNSQIDTQYIARIFEFKFMKLNGFEAQTNFCHNCHQLKNQMYFDENGVVCKNCLDPTKTFCKISPNAINLLNHLVHTKFNELITYSFEKSIIKELIAPSRIFIYSNLEINLNSKKFICEIENSE